MSEGDRETGESCSFNPYSCPLSFVSRGQGKKAQGSLGYMAKEARPQPVVVRGEDSALQSCGGERGGRGGRAGK